MPDVQIFERCHVRVGANANVCYEPAPCVQAPDAHIEAIIAQGRGARLTGRGDRFATLPMAAPAPASSTQMQADARD